MDVFLGIDPGYTGMAYCFYWGNGENEQVIYGNPENMDVFLEHIRMHSPSFAYIEQNTPSMRQKPSQIKHLQRSIGIMEGMFKAEDIKYQEVQAKYWRMKARVNSVAHSIYDDAGKRRRAIKKAVLNQARKEFPHLAGSELRLEKHHDKAEATYIAKACFIDFKEGIIHG